MFQRGARHLLQSLPAEPHGHEQLHRLGAVDELPEGHPHAAEHVKVQRGARDGGGAQRHPEDGPGAEGDDHVVLQRQAGQREAQVAKGVPPPGRRAAEARRGAGFGRAIAEHELRERGRHRAALVAGRGPADGLRVRQRPGPDAEDGLVAWGRRMSNPRDQDLLFFDRPVRRLEKSVLGASLASRSLGGLPTFDRRQRCRPCPRPPRPSFV